MDDLVKGIDSDWAGAFPELKRYARFKYFKVVGPLLMGIELIRTPRDASYRPHFFVYSLWGDDLKASMEGPLCYVELYDGNLRQNFIPFEKHSAFFPDTVAAVGQQLPFSLVGDFSFADFRSFFLKHLNSVFVRMAGTHVSAFSHRALVLCALYTGKSENLAEAFRDLEIARQGWKMTRFLEWFGPFEAWLKDLETIVANRDEFMKRVEMNRANSKLKRLVVGDLI